VAMPWNDKNGDDVAQGEINYLADGTRVPCSFANDPTCEINFAGLAANYGLASENIYGGFPRIYNVEQAVQLEHEVFRNLSANVSWFHGSFSDLTSIVNENLKFEGDPAQNPAYAPATMYNPLTGEAITVYARRQAFQSVATRNIEFVDNTDGRGRTYNAINFSFNYRPMPGANVFGGFAFERQLEVNCTTAQDDPNDLRFCDDRENNVPYNKQLKLAGSYMLPYGVQVSASFQSNQSPNSTRTMAITRIANTATATKYPAGCPAPCPAGQVIMDPTVFFQSSLTVPLEAANTTYVERITQLDFKVQKNFQFNRVTISPVLEVFNINNTDAIISYVTTNSLSSRYLAPNSIMQPRMIGVGATVKW
jgi:hypothetical protein